MITFGKTSESLLFQILGMDKLPSKENHPISKANAKNADGELLYIVKVNLVLFNSGLVATGEQEAEEKDKVGELNNLRKRRFEANGSDGVAESPKRSLTDEEGGFFLACPYPFTTFIASSVKLS